MTLICVIVVLVVLRDEVSKASCILMIPFDFDLQISRRGTLNFNPGYNKIFAKVIVWLVWPQYKYKTNFRK